MLKEVFLEAIEKKKKVRVSYHEKARDIDLVRKCAPKRYGPIKRSTKNDDFYHFWNYEGEPNPHPMRLRPEQIHNIEMLDEEFDPADFTR